MTGPRPYGFGFRPESLQDYFTPANRYTPGARLRDLFAPRRPRPEEEAAERVAPGTLDYFRAPPRTIAQALEQVDYERETPTLTPPRSRQGLAQNPSLAEIEDRAETDRLRREGYLIEQSDEILKRRDTRRTGSLPDLEVVEPFSDVMRGLTPAPSRLLGHGFGRTPTEDWPGQKDLLQRQAAAAEEDARLREEELPYRAGQAKRSGASTFEQESIPLGITLKLASGVELTPKEQDLVDRVRRTEGGEKVPRPAATWGESFATGLSETVPFFPELTPTSPKKGAKLAGQFAGFIGTHGILGPVDEFAVGAKAARAPQSVKRASAIAQLVGRGDSPIARAAARRFLAEESMFGLTAAGAKSAASVATGDWSPEEALLNVGLGIPAGVAFGAGMLPARAMGAFGREAFLATLNESSDLATRAATAASRTAAEGAAALRDRIAPLSPEASPVKAPKRTKSVGDFNKMPESARPAPVEPPPPSRAEVLAGRAARATGRAAGRAAEWARGTAVEAVRPVADALANNPDLVGAAALLGFADDDDSAAGPLGGLLLSGSIARRAGGGGVEIPLGPRDARGGGRNWSDRVLPDPPPAPRPEGEIEFPMDRTAPDYKQKLLDYRLQDPEARRVYEALDAAQHAEAEARDPIEKARAKVRLLEAERDYDNYDPWPAYGLPIPPRPVQPTTRRARSQRAPETPLTAEPGARIPPRMANDGLPIVGKVSKKRPGTPDGRELASKILQARRARRAATTPEEVAAAEALAAEAHAGYKRFVKKYGPNAAVAGAAAVAARAQQDGNEDEQGKFGKLGTLGLLAGTIATRTRDVPWSFGSRAAVEIAPEAAEFLSKQSPRLRNLHVGSGHYMGAEHPVSIVEVGNDLAAANELSADLARVGLLRSRGSQLQYGPKVGGDVRLGEEGAKQGNTWASTITGKGGVPLTPEQRAALTEAMKESGISGGMVTPEGASLFVHAPQLNGLTEAGFIDGIREAADRVPFEVDLHEQEVGARLFHGENQAEVDREYLAELRKTAQGREHLRSLPEDLEALRGLERKAEAGDDPTQERAFATRRGKMIGFKKQLEEVERVESLTPEERQAELDAAEAKVAAERAQYEEKQRAKAEAKLTKPEGWSLTKVEAASRATRKGPTIVDQQGIPVPVTLQQFSRLSQVVHGLYDGLKPEAQEKLSIGRVISDLNKELKEGRVHEVEVVDTELREFLEEKKAEGYETVTLGELKRQVDFGARHGTKGELAGFEVERRDKPGPDADFAQRQAGVDRENAQRQERYEAARREWEANEPAPDVADEPDPNSPRPSDNTSIRNAYEERWAERLEERKEEVEQEMEDEWDSYRDAATGAAEALDAQLRRRLGDAWVDAHPTLQADPHGGDPDDPYFALTEALLDRVAGRAGLTTAGLRDLFDELSFEHPKYGPDSIDQLRLEGTGPVITRRERIDAAVQAMRRDPGLKQWFDEMEHLSNNSNFGGPIREPSARYHNFGEDLSNELGRNSMEWFGRLTDAEKEQHLQPAFTRREAWQMAEPEVPRLMANARTNLRDRREYARVQPGPLDYHPDFHDTHYVDLYYKPDGFSWLNRELVENHAWAGRRGGSNLLTESRGTRIIQTDDGKLVYHPIEMQSKQYEAGGGDDAAPVVGPGPRFTPEERAQREAKLAGMDDRVARIRARADRLAGNEGPPRDVGGDTPQAEAETRRANVANYVAHLLAGQNRASFEGNDKLLDPDGPVVDRLLDNWLWEARVHQIGEGPARAEAAEALAAEVGPNFPQRLAVMRFNRALSNMYNYSVTPTEAQGALSILEHADNPILRRYMSADLVDYARKFKAELEDVVAGEGSITDRDELAVRRAAIAKSETTLRDEAAKFWYNRDMWDAQVKTYNALKRSTTSGRLEWREDLAQKLEMQAQDLAEGVEKQKQDLERGYEVLNADNGRKFGGLLSAPDLRYTLIFLHEMQNLAEQAAAHPDKDIWFALPAPRDRMKNANMRRPSAELIYDPKIDGRIWHNLTTATEALGMPAPKIEPMFEEMGYGEKGFIYGPNAEHGLTDVYHKLGTEMGPRSYGVKLTPEFFKRVRAGKGLPFLGLAGLTLAGAEEAQAQDPDGVEPTGSPWSTGAKLLAAGAALGVAGGGGRMLWRRIRGAARLAASHAEGAASLSELLGPKIATPGGALETVRSSIEGNRSLIDRSLDATMRFVNEGKFALDPLGEKALQSVQRAIVAEKGVHPLNQRISWDQQRAIAQQIGMDPEQIAKIPKQAIDGKRGAKLLAIRDITNGDLDQIAQAYDRIGELEAIPDPTASQMDEKLQLAETIEALQTRVNGLMTAYMPLWSQSGRDLNTMKILAQRWKLDPVTNPQRWLAHAQRVTDGALTDAEKVEILSLARGGDSNKLVRYINSRVPSTGVEKVSTVMRSNLLLGFAAPVWNILSQVGNQAFRVASGPPTAALDILASAYSKRRAFKGWSVAQTKAGLTGARVGVTEMRRMMQGVELPGAGDKIDMHAGRGTNFDKKAVDRVLGGITGGALAGVATGLIGEKVGGTEGGELGTVVGLLVGGAAGFAKPKGFLQTMTNVAFRAVSAPDRPFYGMALAGSIANQAEVLAQNYAKGLPAEERAQAQEWLRTYLTRHPTEEMAMTGAWDAAEATFQNKGAVRKMVGNVRKAFQSPKTPTEIRRPDQVPSAAGPLGELGFNLTLPFTGVPSAVYARAVEGAGGGAIEVPFLMPRFLDAVRAGDTRTADLLQRRMVQAGGRVVVGAGLMAYGYQLAQEAMATGAGPEEGPDKLRKKATGEAPRSSVSGRAIPGVPDDLWVNAMRFPPVGLYLAAGAYKAEMDANPDLNPSERVTGLWTGLSRSVLEMPMLTGVKQLQEGLADPMRRGSTFIEGLARRPVPAIAQRGTRGSLGGAFSDPRGPWEALQSTMPGFADRIPVQVDALGQIPRQPGGWLGAQLALPVTRDKTQGDPFLAALRDVDFPLRGVTRQVGEPDSAYQRRRVASGLRLAELLRREYDSTGTILHPDSLGGNIYGRLRTKGMDPLYNPELQPRIDPRMLSPKERAKANSPSRAQVRRAIRRTETDTTR